MTLKQYMRELWLMDRQYGQEEELYPLVNMLLREGGNTENLSIRDVAEGTAADSIRGRELISGFASFPDLAILGEDFIVKYENEIKEKEDKKNIYSTNMLNICGCVEVKKLSEKLRDASDIPELNCRKSDKAWRYILVKGRNEDAEGIELKIVKVEEKYKKGDKGDLTKQGGKIEEIGQLLGELLWYGKVLYTNGLVWKYIKIRKCSWCENNVKRKNMQELRKDLFKKCNEGYIYIYIKIKNEEDIDKDDNQGNKNKFFMDKDEFNTLKSEVVSFKKTEGYKNLKTKEEKEESIINKVIKKSFWGRTLWLELLVQKFEENNLTIKVEVETIGDLTRTYEKIKKIEANNSKNLFENLDGEDYQAWTDFKSKLAGIIWQEKVSDSDEQKE